MLRVQAVAGEFPARRRRWRPEVEDEVQPSARRGCGLPTLLRKADNVAHGKT
ncbi:MAG: hypothetical protein LBH06_09975 [Rikenellaceae bacterium]|nr:hypothetical protein [Rikenellaceae bacterium]